MHWTSNLAQTVATRQKNADETCLRDRQPQGPPGGRGSKSQRIHDRVDGAQTRSTGNFRSVAKSAAKVAILVQSSSVKLLGIYKDGHDHTASTRLAARNKRNMRRGARPMVGTNAIGSPALSIAHGRRSAGTVCTTRNLIPVLPTKVCSRPAAVVQPATTYLTNG